MSTAIANRNFFESRKNGQNDYGSAHYVVGLQGEIIRCLPDEEMAYHVGSKTYTQEALNKLSSYPNDCTVGIEMCHIDWDGRFAPETYTATVELAATLLHKFELNETNLWTHWGIVGWKDCPRWFVNHPSDWGRFRTDVANKMKELFTVEELTWQEKAGLNAVASLAKKIGTDGRAIIQSPETWTQEKMNEPAPTWLVMVLLDRIAK
jgi:N-acetylmuramoyl-L-alanine amidase CwlA